MGGPNPRVWSDDAHRFALLVDRSCLESRRILQPIESFDLNGSEVFGVRADFIWGLLPRRALHRFDQIDEIAVPVYGAERLLGALEAGVDTLEYLQQRRLGNVVVRHKRKAAARVEQKIDVLRRGQARIDSDAGGGLISVDGVCSENPNAET